MGAGEQLQRVSLVKYRNESMDMVRGTVEIIPDPTIEFGDIAALGGLGAFFSGNYYIASVTHDISTSKYTMKLDAIKQEWDGSAVIYMQEKPSTNHRKPKPKAPYKTQSRTHVVASGETLSSIAYKYYKNSSKWRVIEKVNHAYLVQMDSRNSNGDGSWIYPAMKLIIP